MSRSDRFDRGDFGARYATSPWGKNGQPYQPVVLSSSQLFVVATVTTIGFTVKTVQGMGGASTVDVGFAVWTG